MGDEPWNGQVRIGDLSEDISFLTRTIRARMRPEINALRRQIGVAPGEIGILRIIGLNPGISQNDLAATVVIKKSAATKVVHDLVAGGLVDRRQVTSDKRYNALFLTDKGAAVVAAAKGRVNALHDDWFQGFDAEERRELFRLLGKLADALADRPGGADRIDED